MGLLSGDDIKDLFGDVFGDVYEDAVLQIWETSTVRNPETGTFSLVNTGQVDVKVQRDECTETQRGASNHSNVAQRGSYEYTTMDVRFLILQSGVSVVPTSDCRLVYRGATYMLFDPIEQDPFRVYWDTRAREMRYVV